MGEGIGVTTGPLFKLHYLMILVTLKEFIIFSKSDIQISDSLILYESVKLCVLFLLWKIYILTNTIGFSLNCLVYDM